MDMKESKNSSKTEENKNGGRTNNICNLISDLFMCWIFPIIFKANKRALKNDDLIYPYQKYYAMDIGENFERFWIDEINKATAGNRKPSLRKALTKAYFWSYVPSTLFTLVSITAGTMQPIVFSWLLSYWCAESTMSSEEASYYAIALIVFIFLDIMCQHHNTKFMAYYGMKIKISCSTLVYKKVLRLSQLSLCDVSNGILINILSNDMAKFENAFTYLCHLLMTPFQVVIILYFLYKTVGYAPFVGLFGVIFFLFPLQVTLIKFNAYLRRQTAQRTDKRLKIISELIEGMQIIKMYAWEKPFETIVQKTRLREITWFKKSIFWRSVFIGFILFTERSILYITILTLMLTGTLPEGSVIYPIQQFFNIIQINIGVVVPLAIANFSEMMVSLKRIQEFLLIDEKDDVSILPKIHNFNSIIFNNNKLDAITHGINGKISLQEDYSYNDNDNKTEVFVELSKVSASWKNMKNSTEMTLHDISLQFKKSRLYAIVGRVGAGKSSLLQVILKELPIRQGQLIVKGKVSYASQEPWLFPTTVRENILFGLPYDVNKYKQICTVCALIQDFNQLPFNDLTLVGERGVSLSGGQKARITLARAIYREADVYLLDDPLSAVDTKVGKQLFKECIKTYLRGRTCILVTHQNQYLKEVDEIFIMNKGSVEATGTYDELMKSEKTFSLLDCNQRSKNNDNTENDTNVPIETNSKDESDEISENENTQVMETEKSAIGLIKWSVLYKYLGSVKSWWIVFATSCTFLATQGLITVIDYFLCVWTNEMDEYLKLFNDGDVRGVSINAQIGLLRAYEYIWIYGSLLLILIFISHVRLYAFAVTATRASKNIHDMIFKSIASTTMRFLDTNPSGRILNRFSSDIGAMDEQMPRCLLETVQMYLIVTSVFILTTIALPWTIIPTVVFIGFLFYILKWYLIASQTVKRMDSTTKSPVFNIINSTLSGLPTIRSSGIQSKLLRTFYDAQDLNSKAFYTHVSGIAAFGLYLDLLCLAYLGVILTFFILFDFGEAIPIGNVGMAVSRTMFMSLILRVASRYTADFLGHTIGAERVLEYTKLPTENNLSNEAKLLLDNWPSEGRIQFERLTLKYNEHEAPVLNNLNLEIKAGWKVGVVGRTGAGKSSLISALFRLYTIEGNIKIDGINTNDITKKELRSKISIIPQKPTLFSETVRYNLDPFNDYSDENIWKALEQVELKGVIPALDYKVSEGGSNFSIGQRQLLCLARAILRSNKILVMDEATANVDYQTDEFIQKTIRREFASCTVITVAHRLNTIMDSDRVLVMDKGIVLEFDHPYVLLSDTNSAFTSLVKETGDNRSKEFLEIAKRKYFGDNQTL